MAGLIGALIAFMVIMVDEYAGWGLRFFPRLFIILAIEIMLFSAYYLLMEGKR